MKKVLVTRLLDPDKNTLVEVGMGSHNEIWKRFIEKIQPDIKVSYDKLIDSGFTMVDVWIDVKD